MSWDCINPAELLPLLMQESPVAALHDARDAIMGRMKHTFRDGLWWGDERLWQGSGSPRPFNLSPLLPDDFPIGKPDEMFAEAERLLGAGEWEKGWQFYEFRHSIEQGRNQMPRLFMPHWDGKSPCRRLLVHAEQGAGDTIMFARYLAELDRRGIVSDFVVSPNMERLMMELAYTGKIITHFDEHVYDYHIPLCSLPLALGIYPPMQCEPYLPFIRWESGQVGIVWAGQSFHPRNATRCLTLEQILEHVPAGRDAVSLQMGEAKKQLAFAPEVEDATATINNWLDTADFLAGLDLLVTIDTGIAHLAGAMGVPVKLVLKEPVEWRWKSGAKWYDSVEIIKDQHKTPTRDPLSRPERCGPCSVPDPA